ncbi:uncharacterized protein BDR25DRAFT_265839 [Lindgomyces ingoldianus]|uniref:Uncharacterized protein n=1 Tax=Lindgomyces ingoldianus TaxID=673940 RepID=A0ACB6QMS6_9PLEO|nr:uncharacterized protein BDR25DRAFT_265839 [Lindgomyces ingoldianus]KAF2468167.1 hypothetical protein BDR25DRAFT_265839 [Lindgomyces ingoldianus]
MSASDLFRTLLRPAVLHILRASGFHSAKPSVIDTLVDLTSRYLLLVASRTAHNAYSNHNDLTPDITDVRMAMQDCGILVPSLTAAEELWKDKLRKPLDDYEEETGARAKEERRRDAEDTADVNEFIEWAKGDHNMEIHRIAGTAKPQNMTETEALDAMEMEDYLNTLMKKHSKTGVESRFQGTALGSASEAKHVRIEGGPVDSIQDWCRRTREKAAKMAESAPKNHDSLHDIVESREEFGDMVMES